MSTNIYILKLECNKFYVGKTDNLEQRSLEHYNGTASTYTKKYKPISIEKIIPNASPFDEDKYTKEYMSNYGINNVRGGTYTQIKLDNNTIKLLEKEMRGSNNLCFKCGSKSHFANNCYAKTNIHNKKIISDSDSYDKKKSPK